MRGELIKRRPCPYCKDTDIRAGSSRGYEYGVCQKCEARGPRVWHGLKHSTTAEMNRAFVQWNRGEK